MTDIVGRGQPDRYHVRRLALPQFHFIDHRGCRRDYRPVEVRRAAIYAGGTIGTLESIVSDRFAFPVHDLGAVRGTAGRYVKGRPGLVNFCADSLVQPGHRRHYLAALKGGKSVAFPPIYLVNIVAAHHQGCPVFARHRDIARFW